MIRFSAAWLAGLSYLFWAIDLQTNIIVASAASIFLLVLLSPSKMEFQPASLTQGRFGNLLVAKNEFRTIAIGGLLGIIWSCISSSVWLLQVPNTVSKPGIYDVSGYICSIPSVQIDNPLLAKGDGRYSATDKNNNAAPKEPQVSRVTFDFCVDSDAKGNWRLWPFDKLRITRYRPSNNELQSIRAGRYWQFEVKLKPLHGRLNPGGFDYQKWLVSEGYLATGYVRQGVQLSAETSLKAAFHAFRQSLYDALIEVIPNSSSRGMLLALAMGERTEISDEQWNVVSHSGTSHLLAISGLHIGIAALWSYWVVLFLARQSVKLTNRWPAQQVAQVASLFGAFAIALISGFDYPAQRAVIMLSVFLFSRWTFRHLSSARVLATSVVVISLLQPFAILSISFWLSVFAVAAILFIVSHGERSAGKTKKIRDWLRVNWFLFIALTPISWFVFDRFSIVSYLANLILIPVTTFLTAPLIYLGLIALVINRWIAESIFFVADWLVDASYTVQSYLANINQLLPVGSLPVVLIAVLLLAVFLILLPSKLPGRIIVLPITMIISGYLLQPNATNGLKVVVLDVGQGLAVYVNQGDKHLLYDTGYGTTSYSIAQTSLVPYLKRQGISKLDYMVISHDDADHSGGVPYLLSEVEVGNLLRGERIKSLQSPQAQLNQSADVSGTHRTKPSAANSLASKSLEKTQNCHQTGGWQWGDVSFSMLRHTPDNAFTNGDPGHRPSTSKAKRQVKPISGNNASCVLLIEFDSRRILVTGDIERPAEKRLLQNGLEVADVLIAPHHGSETSSSKAFVESVRPEHVIFSTGFANRWGFPRQKVLERYNNVGSKVWTTADAGAVTIVIERSSQLAIYSERDRRHHFWQSNPLPDP